MAIAYVQSASAAGDGASGSIAAAFPGNVGTGQRLLIASVFWVSGVGTAALTDISTVADTLVTSFTNAAFAPGSNGVDTHWGLATYWGIAPAGGGADTVTVTFAATPSFRRMAVTEVSGPLPTSPVDQIATAFNGGNTLADSGSMTTTMDGELIYGFVQLGNVATITAGTNETFTARELAGAGTAPFATEDAVQAAAGSTAVRFTLSTGQSWGCQMVTFKPAVLGGWSPLYRPYTLGAAIDVLTGGLYYYWRRRKQEKPDE